MKAIRYKSWQFIHPDFDKSVIEAGGKSQRTGVLINPTGGIAMAEDAAVVRQSILMLLSTSPGERVMRPNYGCELRRLLFLPNDESTAGLAIHYVRQALNRWEKRIRIIDLNAAANAQDSSLLDIFLSYQVVWNQDITELQLSFSLNDGV